MQVTLRSPFGGQTCRPLFLALPTITLGLALAALWLTRSLNPLRGDSAQYLGFAPSRTVGYPAFLELVRLVSGQVSFAVPAQMLLLAASLVTLSWSFHRLVRRPAYTMAFQFLLIANAGMWFASAFLMTEALSTALVALWVAQLLRMMGKPQAGYRGLLAISCVATTVRPSLLPLFCGSALFALIDQPARVCTRALLITGIAAAAAWSATPLAQLLVHGSANTSSPFARGVLQHTLYCDLNAIPRSADAAFVEATASPVRRYIDAAPPSMQEQFRREYSTPLRFGVIIPVLGRTHHLDNEWQVDSYLAPIAKQRVLANPECYAKSVVNEYFRLAAFDTDPTAQQADDVNAFIKQHPPVQLATYPVLAAQARLAHQAGVEVHRKPAGLNPPHMQLHVASNVPLAALLPFRVLYGAAALVGGIAILALLARRRWAENQRPTVILAAVLGTALHGILAITAIVEIGSYRYLIPCWPIVCTLVALATMTLNSSARLPWLAVARARLGRTQVDEGVIIGSD